MTGATGVTSYAYDSRDRLLSEATPQGALTYTYGKLGSLRTVRSSNADGVSVDYAYDELSRLKDVADDRLSENNVKTYSYDGAGNLESYTYGNGVKRLYAYDPLNRLTSLGISKAASTINSYSHTLGAAGNRESVTDANRRTVA
jgi:YD repeat-containing protein